MRIDPLKLAPVTFKSTLDSQASKTNSTDSTEKSFGELFKDAIEGVNKLQNDAQQASINLAAGKVQDLSEVVIATEKASVALQLTMQVRNKIVDAYHEIMRIQV